MKTQKTKKTQEKTSFLSFHPKNFSFLTWKTLRRLLLVVIMILALVGVGFLWIFMQQKDSDLFYLQSPVWTKLQARYGIRYQNYCGNGAGMKPCEDNYHTTQARIRILQNLGLGMFFTPEDTKEETLMGYDLLPDGQTRISITSGTTEPIVLSGRGAFFDIDRSYFVDDRTLKRQHIFSGENSIIGKRDYVLQVEINHSPSGGRVDLDYYNPEYTKVTDPYIQLSSHVVGSTIFPRLKSMDTRLCVLLTRETFLNRALIESVGTDCEIMSIPLLAGYPHQLVDVSAYGSPVSDTTVTITPRVVESLY